MLKLIESVWIVIDIPKFFLKGVDHIDDLVILLIKGGLGLLVLRLIFDELSKELVELIHLVEEVAVDDFLSFLGKGIDFVVIGKERNLRLDFLLLSLFEGHAFQFFVLVFVEVAVFIDLGFLGEKGFIFFLLCFVFGKEK